MRKGHRTAHLKQERLLKEPDLAHHMGDAQRLICSGSRRVKQMTTVVQYSGTASSLGGVIASPTFTAHREHLPSLGQAGCKHTSATCETRPGDIDYQTSLKRLKNWL